MKANMNGVHKEAEREKIDSAWDVCFNLFAQTSRAYLEGVSKTRTATLTSCLKNQPLRETSTPLPDVFEYVAQDIVPQLSVQRGRTYFAYVTGGSTPAATAADWLVATFDQNVKKDGCSIASDVERQAIVWLTQLFLLPDCFRGIFTTGGTVANLLGLLAGRQFVGLQQGVNVTLDGVGAAKIKVFCASPHESVLKCMGFSGIGQSNLIRVPSSSLVNEEMDIDMLEVLLTRYEDCGKIVVASAGTVSGTAFDNMVAIRKVCDRHNAWLHVDGAFGLYERLVTGKHGRTNGVEYADSIAVDCHKWLNVPYDSGVCLVRNLSMLQQACYVDSPYFASRGPEFDFLTLGIENSRRFRAFPVWFTLLTYGREGVVKWVKGNIDLASNFANWIEAESPSYELLHYGELNVVLFRPVSPADGKDSDTNTLNHVRLINEGGIMYLNPTMWNKERVLRLAIANYSTTEKDMQRVKVELERIASKISQPAQ
eukprot:CFRG2473T1